VGTAEAAEGVGVRACYEEFRFIAQFGRCLQWLWEITKMESHAENFRKWSVRLLAAPILLAVVFAVGSCGGTNKSGGAAAQKSFNTPEEAGQALQAAAKSGDQNSLVQILGSDSKPIVSSGDPAEDKATLDSFTAKYDQMNRWVTTTDGSRVLYIGADNYPFPIPLAKDSSSKWRFNAAAGQGEILARRVGRNELLAIDAVSAIANAEEIYFSSPHDSNPAHLYTPLLISSPGKQDALYWPVPASEPASPLGRLDEFAGDAIAAAAHGGPPVFDGYYYRILSAQGAAAKGGAKNYITGGKMSGGFAVLAYPVKYQDSGVMTFILSREGTVYENDLGAKTADIAAAIKEYDPTDDWTPVE